MLAARLYEESSCTTGFLNKRLIVHTNNNVLLQITIRKRLSNEEVLIQRPYLDMKSYSRGIVGFRAIAS